VAGPIGGSLLRLFRTLLGPAVPAQIDDLRQWSLLRCGLRDR
jgi:hypothetical protein